MMGFIALKSKSDIIVPRHEADASLFVGLGIVLLIAIVGMYLEIRKEKKQERSS